MSHPEEFLSPQFTAQEPVELSRSRFRELFQPSRIVIALLPSPIHESGYNPITLCFTTWASYNPRMMGIAIQDSNFSHGLVKEGTPISLSIPGRSLVDETIYFGTRSGREYDKLITSGVHLVPGQSVDVPALKGSLGAIELETIAVHPSGDHVMVIGEVTAMLGYDMCETPLVSVGARTRGFTVLRKHGQHRIAVPSQEARPT
ncbi:flavin reductase family protein [Mycobacterium sp. OAE908]|uniref:flavin reductase family protein n=1 Tax=Mycobacterium sp. OAE908 TaxID=2817899 RepID=UPI001AE66CA2